MAANLQICGRDDFGIGACACGKQAHSYHSTVETPDHGG
jgi:hypothetical protein